MLHFSDNIKSMAVFMIQVKSDADPMPNPPISPYTARVHFSAKGHTTRPPITGSIQSSQLRSCAFRLFKVFWVKKSKSLRV